MTIIGEMFEEQIYRLEAENARLEQENLTLKSALRSFLNLVSKDIDGKDGLQGLPDDHLFEMVWADDEHLTIGGNRIPTITAGQIRRAKALL